MNIHSITDRINRAWLLFDLTCYQLSLLETIQVLGVEPECAEAHSLHGLCLVNMNQHKAGIAAIKYAIAIDPDEACYHQHLALAYLECENFGVARQSIDRAIELDPQDVISWLITAQITNAVACYMDTGYSLILHETAIYQADRALGLNPRNVNALYIKLSSLYKLDRMTELEAGCDRLLSIEPNHAPTYNLIGLLHQQRQQWGRSIGFFRIALNIQPNLTLAQSNLSHSYSRIAKTYDILSSMQHRFEQETIIKE